MVLNDCLEPIMENVHFDVRVKKQFWESSIAGRNRIFLGSSRKGDTRIV